MQNKGNYKCLNHLMPAQGWLNDPNGLCYFNQKYHIFFQANPTYPKGGLKEWGLYTTVDFKKYTYEGIVLHTDSLYDQNGCYSGSAIAYQDKLYLFYTGNYKEEGNFDYINEGRHSTVLRVESIDGIHFTNKKVILLNKDYPKNLTNHVRDPKLFQVEDTYYMVLGARDKMDKGSILIYKSKDLDTFVLEQEVKSMDLGYMLECPDIFKLEDKYVVSFSPQGVEKETDRFLNLYSSGYILNKLEKSEYIEWDKGYDFYAPQTFLDHKNRRILIGWAGLDDEKLDISYPTTEDAYFMHMLTYPRELKLKGNKITQFPIQEILDLAKTYKNEIKSEYINYHAKIKPLNDFTCVIHKSLKIMYNEGKIEVSFLNNAYGRKPRTIDLDIKEIDIFVDKSIVEIYLNHGEAVFTSRVFSFTYGFETNASKNDVLLAAMEEFIYE